MRQTEPMSEVTQYPAATPKESPDPALEVLRLSALLDPRGAVLAALKKSLRALKTRYASRVGSRLAELAELEQAIREAEARTLGVEAEEEDAHGTTATDA